MRRDPMLPALPVGLIFEIARDAGIEMRKKSSKRAIRCPFHEDRSPSAFVSSSNVFFCSVCTPDGGLSAKHFTERLGLDWSCYLRNVRDDRRRLTVAGQARPFTAADACALWSRIYARARDDDAVECDRNVYAFLARRGLAESWEEGAFGILTPSPDLHPNVASWPIRGYALVAPLYDAHGLIANLQSRAIVPQDPKTLFPLRSVAAGTLFACSRGLEILRGTWDGPKRVLFAEGLTDHLALTVVSPIPLLSAPGTSLCVSGIGPWVSGFETLLAVDWDAAGDNAVQATARRALQLGAVSVRRVEWPDAAKDACDVVERRGIVGLEAFLREVTA